jgi:hypothetical protein
MSALKRGGLMKAITLLARSRCRRIDLFIVSIDGRGREKGCAVDPGSFDTSREKLIDAMLDAWGNLGINGSYRISKGIEDKINAHIKG